MGLFVLGGVIGMLLGIFVSLLALFLVNLTKPKSSKLKRFRHYIPEPPG